MKLEGSAQVAGTREALYERLLDPAFLARCIPGCESLERVAEDTYDITVNAGVGPVKGSFRGQVRLTDQAPPEGYLMNVSGKSPVGHAEGSARLRLAEHEGGVRITYEGEARVSGLIASVGGRLVGAAAKKVAAQFFDKVAEEVSVSG